MNPGACSREKELTQLLARGQWPEATPLDLRNHVSACRRCGDLVLVTETFRRARIEAIGSARPGSPGALWWRAQLRRRTAAVERVGKPILGAQIFALSINLILMVGLVASQARHGLGWLTRMEALLPAAGMHLERLWPAALLNPGWGILVIVPAIATLALLGGAVVYFSSER
jgi:hypothetical protein